MAVSSAGSVSVVIPARLKEEDVAVFTSRVVTYARQFERDTGVALSIQIDRDTSPQSLKSGIRTLWNRSPNTPAAVITEISDDELSIEQRASRFQSRPPIYDHTLLVLPPEVGDALRLAADYFQYHKQVFEGMGLKRIEPSPSVILSFYGQPGTGKTLAAHTLAHELGKPILVASYAEIESKYRGDAPKNLRALFYAAQRDDAVLFIDEADSLLSRRFTMVNQGAEEAANSLRTEMALALDQYDGIVIFATNLMETYDQAFASRTRSIYFPPPNWEGRRAIWQSHLVFETESSSMMADDLDFEALANIDQVVGRDIKRAIIDAAFTAVRRDGVIRQEDLMQSILSVRHGQLQQKGADITPAEADPETAARIQTAVKKKRTRKPANNPLR